MLGRYQNGSKRSELIFIIGENSKGALLEASQSRQLSSKSTQSASIEAKYSNQ